MIKEMNRRKTFLKDGKKKVSGIYYKTALLLLMYSCSKEPLESALTNKSILCFTMAARRYSFDRVQSAEQYKSCGLQQLEICAMNNADEFFKINITGDSACIRPAIYYMDEVPTNQISNSCTFWYTGLNENYTARRFTITVVSYENEILTAIFGGDRITDGKIRNMQFTIRN
jgi:hypothetical protein